MSVAVRPLRVVELCAGYGGFSLALRHAGVDHRTVAYVERDSHAAATLVARMEDEALDQAPVWSDLDTFDGAAWRGAVDLVAAGFPCQPWSAAGLKGGVDDHRWLWPSIRRCIADVGPSYVFVENVPPINPVRGVGGLPFVLQDLADLGFDAEWSLYSASDVGAPHRRERFWLLGYTRRPGRPEITRSAPGHEGSDGRWANGSHVTDGPGQGLGDAEGEGLPVPVGGRRGSQLSRPERAGVDLGDPDDARQPEPGGLQLGERETEIRRRTRDAGGSMADSSGLDEREPDPDDWPDARRLAWQDTLGRSTPVADPGSIRVGEKFRPDAHQRESWRPNPETGGRAWPPGRDDVEGWRQWTARGGPQPLLRREVDGATGRLVKPVGIADRIHLLGNGLVPQCAAEAFLQLARRGGLM